MLSSALSKSRFKLLVVEEPSGLFRSVEAGSHEEHNSKEKMNK